MVKGFDACYSSKNILRILENSIEDSDGKFEIKIVLEHDTSLLRNVLLLVINVEGYRNRGRPNKVWVDDIQEESECKCDD